MSRRNASILVAFVAFVAYFLSLGPLSWFRSRENPRFTRSGRNNTVLFFTNDDYGLSNVHLAAVNSLLLNHPDIEVHYSSFPPWQKRIQQIEDRVARRTNAERSVKFHPLPHSGMSVAMDRYIHFQELYHRPGLPSTVFWSHVMNIANMPWEQQEYLDIYEAATEVLLNVDPAVVVFPPEMHPALQAVRDLNWRHVFLIPNSLKEYLAPFQPRGEMLWKYPAIGSAFTYPVPWRQIPTNIYLTLSIYYHLISSPRFKATRSWLAEKGFSSPVRLDQTFLPGVPAILQGNTDTDYPFAVIPDNVKMAGPIYVLSAPAHEQDPELTLWLAEKPTILINLGSHVDYTRNTTLAIVHAMRAVFDARPGVQFLWKYNMRKESRVQNFAANEDEFPLELFTELDKEMADGRVKLTHWIKAEPAALLATGHIIATVHHGGASCFFEGIAMGVPHIVLPTWSDCFDMAMRAEYLGIGVYGARHSSPYWDGEELAASFLRVLGEHEEAKYFKDKAEALASTFKSPGRDIAAAEIARLARH